MRYGFNRAQLVSLTASCGRATAAPCRDGGRRMSARTMAGELNKRAIPTLLGGKWHAMQALRVWERLRSFSDEWLVFFVAAE